MADTDNLLDGLNELTNMADKKPAKAGPAQRQAAQQSSVSSDTASPAVASQPAEDPALSRQILSRLDGIKASIDALRNAGSAPSVAPEKQPVVQTEKPKFPPRPAPRPAPIPAAQAPAKSALQVWPYLILVSAAIVLIAFALGMGYGAIVASGKFPFWYRPGVAGVIADWVAAPAGVLLLPIIAGLLALGGWELQREGRERAAKIVWALAGGLALLAILAPFLA